MMNNKIIKPSAMIFDFDDTLVDSKPIITKSLEKTFKHFNIDESLLKNIDFNLSLRDYFHEIFADNLEQAKDTYYSHYFNYAQNLKALNKAEEVLKFLRDNNVYTAIVSNKNGPRLRYEVNDYLGWGDYFVEIIGAGDCKADKPSPIPALQALKGSGVNNHDDVWFVGDSLIDVKTAKNLGCRAVLFGVNHIQNIPIYFSVENHNNLLKILQELYA